MKRFGEPIDLDGELERWKGTYDIREDELFVYVYPADTTPENGRNRGYEKPIEMIRLEDATPERPVTAVDEAIIRNLRRQKAEEAYEEYVHKLHATYPVEINAKEWQRIFGSG